MPLYPLGQALIKNSAPGRLTLTTVLPVTTSDVTAALVLYYTPYVGDQLALYDGTAWAAYALSEISIKATDSAQTGTMTSGNKVISGLTDTSQLIVGMQVSGTNVGAANTIVTIDSATQVTTNVNSTGSASNAVTFKLAPSLPVDVFAFANAGTPKLEWCVWTNATTRATALVMQDGVLCKTGVLTRRYLGTVYVGTTAGQLEDSIANRLVWNMYNQVLRSLKKVDTTATWSYSVATWRQTRAQAGNQVTFVLGQAAMVDITHTEIASDQFFWTAVGLDSTTVPTSAMSGATNGSATSRLCTIAAVGYHYAAMMENLFSAVATTFQGTYGTVGANLAHMDGYVNG